MQKKLLVSLLVSLALSVPAGYAVYLLTDSDFLSPGILRLMQALAVLLLIFIWGEFALLVRDARRNAHQAAEHQKARRDALRTLAAEADEEDEADPPYPPVEPEFFQLDDPEAQPEPLVFRGLSVAPGQGFSPKENAAPKS